jgi:hypothetical protein
MEAQTATPTDAAFVLSRATYYQVTHTLRRLLPPPITDTPEDAVRRDCAAIAHVASLLPATPDEANLAAQYVGASAQALDCQRLAREHEGDLRQMLRCFAQSARMMREAKSWRLALMRAQAAREARDGDETAREAATAAETRVLSLMADALAHGPPPPAPSAAPKAAPQPSPIAEAERYATLHRKNASLIRRLGRMPDRLDIGGLAPEVVHAIATGTTPILAALGAKSVRAAAVAAA